MEILKVCGTVILGLILVTILKNGGNKLSNGIPIITFLIVAVYAISSVRDCVGYIKNISSMIPGSEQFIPGLFRVCGINLLSHSIITLCNENGEKTLANTMELATDIATLAIALPIFIEAFELVLNTLSTG